jgi:hypothetical protein
MLIEYLATSVEDKVIVGRDVTERNGKRRFVSVAYPSILLFLTLFVVDLL